MSQYDIVGLGECLIDVICKTDASGLVMEGNAGGAPANMLAMASRLGLKTALISQVGADGFGSFLQEQIAKAGIDTSGMLVSHNYPTTLAMVQLDETGNRSFGFYRTKTADVMLECEDLPCDLLQNTRMLHFGSLSLTTEPVRSATFAALELARNAGALISYDPNLRLVLWESLSQAKQMILQGMTYADYVKVSEEELEFLTDCKDVQSGALQLYEAYHMPLLAVTCGSKGCVYCIDGVCYTGATFDTACIDTTGAGDASWGAAMCWLLEHDFRLHELSAESIVSWMDFANAAGSLATTKKGAIPAMPTRAEILQCIQNVSKLQ